MPTTTTELDESDIKAALAFWVESGCPPYTDADTKRVTLNYCPKVGNDPREYAYHYASVAES